MMAQWLRRSVGDMLLRPCSRSFSEATTTASTVPPLTQLPPTPARPPPHAGVLDVGDFTIRDFLKSIANGVDAHVDKISSKVEDLRDLLVLRASVLKKIGIPCKHRKLIMRYTHKYRMGVWKPRTFKKLEKS